MSSIDYEAGKLAAGLTAKQACEEMIGGEAVFDPEDYLTLPIGPAAAASQCGLSAQYIGDLCGAQDSFLMKGACEPSPFAKLGEPNFLKIGPSYGPNTIGYKLTTQIAELRDDLRRAERFFKMLEEHGLLNESPQSMSDLIRKL